MQLIALCERINRLADNRCVRANANVALHNGREGKHRDSGFEPAINHRVRGDFYIGLITVGARELNALFINIDFIRERITPIASAQNKYSFREERSANGEEQKEERREGRERTNIVSAYAARENEKRREGAVRQYRRCEGKVAREGRTVILLDIKTETIRDR